MTNTLTKNCINQEQKLSNDVKKLKDVKGLEKYVEAAKNKKYIDPYTGKKPSKEAIGFANDALTFSVLR